MVVKVGVNGFGTIGKRVSDALQRQSDMKLVGVVKTRPDYKARLAQTRGYRLYVPDEKSLKRFEERGLEAHGTLEDLLKEVDVVVDATPAGVGEKYKPLYERKPTGGIFQGGEEGHVADVSFVAQCNFEKAVKARFVRCVSCNTTGLCRTLGALEKAFGVRRARATIVRRAADPDDAKRGPINAIVPDPTELPSHHGPDVNTVLPQLPIVTMAVKVPNTYMHVHTVAATLKSQATREDVLRVFEDTTRVMLISNEEGLSSTASLFDYARELRRSRNDLYEICVWRESVAVVDGEVYYMQAVDQEADVVPENIDAIRAMLNLASAESSIKATNQSLGILK